jgi:hypothetical protein
LSTRQQKGPEGMHEALRDLIERHQQGRPTEPPARPARLPLGSIKEMPEVYQPRDGIADFHITELVKAIDRVGDLDPITVMMVGDQCVLINGHHRLEAYRRAKRKPKDVPVRYFDGDPLQALIEAGSENGKVRLNLTSRERQDFAWRLVLTGLLTRPQIEEAAGISRAQVTLMRKAMTVLGDDAGHYSTWFKARNAANGREQQQFTDEDIQMWKEQRSDRIADEMARRFGMNLVNDTEIAAMALAKYFGRKLEDLVRDLGGHLPEDFEMDPVGGLF